MAYESTWAQPSTTPRIRQPSSGMYGTPDPSTGDATGGQTSGMYSSVNSPMSGGLSALDFTKLGAGGQTAVSSGDASVNTVDPNYTGMYQAYASNDASKFGDLANLAGTGLQTQAQRDVAATNIQPAMTKLGIQSTQYFPYLQSLLSQTGLGGTGGGLSSQLTANLLAAANPAREQAALDSAASNASRSAATAQQEGLSQVAGSGWSPSSPVGAALTASSQAAALAAEEEAKRKIRDDYSQQRVANIAQALNLQNNAMSPIYSLLSGLMS